MCLGIPGLIVAVDDEARLSAVVEVSGVRRIVNTACVLAPGERVADRIGSWVLIHAGFAMSRIDADEAARTLALLASLGDDELPSATSPDPSSRGGAAAHE
ncbi:MAG: HypC/HybG/HupF family hydrogenase formation chaperone [Pseudomonadales bacterium]|jgi:hydrogenase expression/formation protein HypC|nr:HypC/HybG/HupF family hydrogenase formation chaperone [Pseudomonadales bacterium]